MKDTSLFRNDIQGLRALSVLAVIVFHYDSQILPGGFIGVDAFLVISGYLITQILLAKKRDTQGISLTLQNFYVNRFKRIVPAYYLMLLLVSLASALLFIENDFSHFYKSLRSSLLFISNQYFGSFGDYFAPSSNEQPLLHTWSLAVEMQFYLLYPLAVLLIPVNRLKQALPLAGLILLIATEIMLNVKGDRQQYYHSLYARVPEFLAGAAIALYGLTDRVPEKKNDFFWFTGLLLLIVSSVFLDGATPFPGLLSIPPVLGTCLLIVSYQSSMSKWLAARPLVWLGSLSYSLYLWHWPILALIRYYTGENELNFYATATFIIGTLFFAVVSYYFVEKYFHKNKRKISSKRPALLLTVSAMLITGFVLVKSISQANEYFSPTQKAIEYRRYADPEIICHGKINGDCSKGNIFSNEKILVLGDSHAAMLNHFFDYLGNELEFKAQIITASSCVTIPGFDYQRLPSWAQKPCIEQIAAAEGQIYDANKVFIAGMWSYQLQSENFQHALNTFLKNASQQGKKVYLLPQVPQLSIGPLRADRFQYLKLPNKTKNTDSASTANALLAKIADQYPNVTYLTLDVNNLFPEVPFYKNELIYFDEDHLNEIGAKLYAQLTKDSFVNLINIKDAIPDHRTNH